MMRWAVVGESGLLGSELMRTLSDNGESVHGFGRSNLDLENDSAAGIAKKLEAAELVVNAVAYTNVDAAEDDYSSARKVNADYAEKLATAAQINGARFIHVSTDFVFSSESSAAIPTTGKLHPINAYGRSKAMGELAVIRANPQSIIFRTAWLYGQGGQGFVQSVSKKLIESGEVSVVDDQFGTPTWSKDLATQISKVGAFFNQGQIQHAVPSGYCSRYEFALQIAESLGIEPEAVKPVKTSPSKNAAQRPKFSVLETEWTASWHERWQVAAPEVLRDFL